MQDQDEPQPASTSTTPPNAPTVEGVIKTKDPSFNVKIRSTKMHPRITVVGAVQADHTSYPDDKTGGPIGTAFIKRLGSAKSANEAAKLVGVGLHAFGSLTLHPSLFEEPAYVDSGKSVAKAPAKAFVIGNDANDETVKMGSVGPQNRKLDKSVKDANKIEKELKGKKYSVVNLPNQSGQNLKVAVSDAASSLKPGTSCVVYFSGHGTIEGLVGTDGKILSPSDLVVLVKKAIEKDSDLVILLDACHSGIMVDGCRSALLQIVRDYCKSNPKMTTFIDAAIDLAGAKNQFMTKSVQDLWKKGWLAGDLASSKDQKDIDQSLKVNEEFYKGWFKVWNDFVNVAQPKINDTVQKGKAAGVATKDLTLKKFTDKEMAKGPIEQDQQKQIWAQLDSLDDIINFAATAAS